MNQSRCAVRHSFGCRCQIRLDPGILRRDLLEVGLWTQNLCFEIRQRYMTHPSQHSLSNLFRFSQYPVEMLGQRVDIRVGFASGASRFCHRATTRAMKDALRTISMAMKGDCIANGFQLSCSVGLGLGYEVKSISWGRIWWQRQKYLQASPVTLSAVPY
jgi:hypothetical protein